MWIKIQMFGIGFLVGLVDFLLLYYLSKKLILSPQIINRTRTLRRPLLALAGLKGIYLYLVLFALLKFNFFSEPSQIWLFLMGVFVSLLAFLAMMFKRRNKETFSL